MEPKKDYHKHPSLTIRIDAAEKERLETFSNDNHVSIAWIIKRSLKLFWEAVKKGDIKP
jgi:hypothetical protein